MAGADETFPPRPVTPPNRRIGALSGNTKGIAAGTDADAEPAEQTTRDTAESTAAETAPTAEAARGAADAKVAGEPDASAAAGPTTPTDNDGSDGSGTSDTDGAGPSDTEAAGTDDDAAAPDITLPHVGELASASEDAIVDPSEAVLESIDLDTWKWPEFFAFALTRMQEIFPTGGIPRGIGPVREYVTEENDFRPLAVDRKRWPAIDEDWTTVGDVLANTHTDAWLVTRNGIALAEEYAWPMKPARQHMLFSVSKSIVATVIGALADAGLLSPADLVTKHVPALAKSGYAGATIRDLLDMRSGIKFSEEYLEKGSEIRALFEAVDFAPRSATSANGIKNFLTGLTSDREHGSAFVYRSCETDVLAWIAEAVTGQPFSIVASEYVWSRIGAAHAAQVCQDRWGGSIADGAISATIRDLARFGEMIARGGTTDNGERVLSAEWVEDIFTGAADSAKVFAASPSGRSYPGGMYRSQFWLPSASRDVVIGIGIHGQMLYIDRATQTVGVKLSSDPEPVSLAAQHGTLAMFEAITEAVAPNATDTAEPAPTEAVAPVATAAPEAAPVDSVAAAAPDAAPVAPVPAAASESAPVDPSIGTPEAEGPEAMAAEVGPAAVAAPAVPEPQMPPVPDVGAAPLISQNTLY